MALDFFARTPGLGGASPAERDFRHEEVDFGATRQVFHVGRLDELQPAVFHEGDVPSRQFDLERVGVVPGAEQDRLVPQCDPCLAALQHEVAHVPGLGFGILHGGAEKAMEIQAALGSDIAMLFDECPPYPCDEHYAANSLALTTRWARRCRDWVAANEPRSGDGPQRHFGIVQGSVWAALMITGATGSLYSTPTPAL